MMMAAMLLLTIKKKERCVEFHKPEWFFFSPFAENIDKKRALDFTAFAQNPPKELKPHNGRAKACEVEFKVSAFEHSRDDNCGMSVKEKLLVSSQKIQLKNQLMLI